jgi:hypothetical protein
VAGERGSVLLLVPAAVLVLVVLGAIAVDFALAFLGQRELNAAAAAAANDAAGAALSDAAFYSGRHGPVEIDPARAEEVAAAALERRRPGGVEVTSLTVRASGPQVCITVVGRVPYLFSPIVPGGPRAAVVRGQAVASAVVGASPVPSEAVLC